MNKRQIFIFGKQVPQRLNVIPRPRLSEAVEIIQFEFNEYAALTKGEGFALSKNCHYPSLAFEDTSILIFIPLI
jgi:hypothetical protein